MKIKLLLVLIAFVAASSTGQAQGFVNLNFEQSTIVSSGPYPFDNLANVKGWTEYNGYGDSNYSNGMTVVYNGQTLDEPGISLLGTNYSEPAIQGDYSILLLGGSEFALTGTNGATIGQTGQIPASAESIIYWGDALQATFNGQALAFTAIGSGSGYTIWQADISAYAGQTGQLDFTAPWETQGMLDNIQFSVNPVPEPGALGLSALGVVLLYCRRWNRLKPKP